MAKQSRCPGCKQTFVNGQPYSMHMSSCKDIGLATDKALKKHKLNTVKQSQVKKADVAAHRESAVWAAEKQAMLSSQVLPDNWDMDTDATMNEVLPVQNSPLPPPRPSGRPNWRTWLPHHYCNELPPNPPIISVSEDLDEHDEPVEPAGCAPCKSIQIPTSALFCMEMNSFGIYHKYALGPLDYYPWRIICTLLSFRFYFYHPWSCRFLSQCFLVVVIWLV